MLSNKIKLSALLMALAVGVPSAQAAVLSTTVTASSPDYQGSLTYLNDGVFPLNSTWYADYSVYNFGNTTFDFALSASTKITGIQASVDNNDDYAFTFYNGATQTGVYVYTAASGNITDGQGGLQYFDTLTTDGDPKPSFSPVWADHVIVSASGGDGAYGIAEVEFTGSAAPEPASWAMLLLGFAGLGVAGHRAKRKLAHAA